MKLLQVIHGFLPQFRGGTELYVYRLARQLRERGHDVEIVAGTTDTAETPRIEDDVHDDFKIHRIVGSGSYTEHWSRSLAPRSSALFEEVLHRVHPDLVHVHHWFRLSRDLVETTRRAGIPAVCTLHDLWTTCPRIFRIRDESFCERPLGGESCMDCVPRLPWDDDATVREGVDLFRADFENELRLAQRIIVPSKAHGQRLIGHLGVPPERIFVLPHGTIADVGADVGERRSPADRKTIRLGMWSHLSHMKGAHLILEALHSLPPETRERFEVHIWGEVIEPGYRRRLESLSEGLSVNRHGKFIPADLKNVVLDCAVIPSLCSESHSFVLDEAFLLGYPVIVSDRGALAERVGRAGRAFQAESAADLARVLEEIARRPTLLDEWRRAIPKLLTMSRHAEAVLSLYRDARRDPLVEPADNPVLTSRRAGHLAALVERHEAVMFGYLGQIKRAEGRGDHYERVVEKMIADEHEFGRQINELRDQRRVLKAHNDDKARMIELLASEIRAFREVLFLVDADSPSLDREMPAPPVSMPRRRPSPSRRPRRRRHRRSRRTRTNSTHCGRRRTNSAGRCRGRHGPCSSSAAWSTPSGASSRRSNIPRRQSWTRPSVSRRTCGISR